jgi:hypothetical protein
MRHPVVLGLLLCTVVAHGGEVSMRISGAAGLTGKAKVVNKLQEDGSKYVLMEMELRSTDGQIVNVLQESVYDKAGMPVRMIQNTSTAGGKEQKIVAVFSGGSVKLRVTVGDKNTEETLQIPAGTNPFAKFEFWFIRDKVTAGGKTGYSRFDLQTSKWERVEATYHGVRDIKVDGKAVKANLVEIGGAKAYVDDKGDPLRVEMQGIVLERVSS